MRNINRYSARGVVPGSVLCSISALGLILGWLAIFATAKAAADGARPSANSLKSAVRGLNSPDSHLRRAAMLNIEEMFGRQDLAILQTAGARPAAGCIGELQFCQGLIRWVQMVQQLPSPSRQAFLNWGLSAQNRNLVADAFSTTPGDRVAAARRLAQIRGPESDWILARLLGDRSPTVYIPAMDAVWNCKPTPAMVHAVWRDATDIFAAMGRRVVVNFDGKPVATYSAVAVHLDRHLASELLAHWNPPELSALVMRRLRFHCRMPHNVAGSIGVSVPPQLKGRDAWFSSLLLAAHPAQAAPLLLHIMLMPRYPSPGNWETGYYYTQRTLPLLLLVELAKLYPKNYGLSDTGGFRGSAGRLEHAWMSHSKAGENRAVTKIIAWYKAHGIVAATASDWAPRRNRPLPGAAPDFSPVRATWNTEPLSAGAFRRAVVSLGSGQPAAATGAIQRIRSIIAWEVGQLVTADPTEHGSALAKIFADAEGFSQLSITALNLPLERRSKLLEWALKPTELPWAAEVFSPSAEQRCSAARSLARVPGWQASWLLEHLLDDGQPAVVLTTMDALWDRPVSSGLASAIFRRVVGPVGTAPGVHWRLVTFRGKVRRISPQPQNVSETYFPSQGVDLLLHLNPRELNSLLVRYMAKIAKLPRNSNFLTGPPTPGLVNFRRLFTSVRPAGAIPYLISMVEKPNIPEGGPGGFQAGNYGLICPSDRALALYLLVRLAHQKPADYGLIHILRTWGNTWLCHTDVQETAAIKRILKWYKAHALLNG